MTPHPPSRLLLALTGSLLLHLAVLAAQLLAPPKAPPVRLEVRLQVPEPPPPEAPPPETAPLDKNTLAPETVSAEPPPKPQPKPSEKPGRLKQPEEQKALRKLADYILYPQAAVDAGHEGTVHLLLKLDPNGTVLAASVAASSGHAILDHAAIQAALRAGRIPSAGKREVILPVTFRLQ